MIDFTVDWIRLIYPIEKCGICAYKFNIFIESYDTLICMYI